MIPLPAPSDARARSLAPAVLAAIGAFGGLSLFLLDGVGVALQPGGGHLAADGDDVGKGVGDDAGADTDADGLANGFESVLRSSPELMDTDGDGFGDLEEFARGSLPYYAGSTPLPGELSSRMTARRGEDVIHLLFATWAADGGDTGLAPGLGILLGDSMIQIPLGYVELHGSIELYGAADGSVIQLVHLPLRTSLFEQLGGISLFGTTTQGGSGYVGTADTVDVRVYEEEIFLRMTTRARPLLRSDLLSASGSGSSGSVYVPLPEPGQIPSTWNSGLICRQTSMVVGVADGVVTREVVSAGCVPAFDSYCKSDCSLAVGSTEKSVDPLALIGG